MRYNKMRELIQAKLVIPISSMELEDSFLLEEKGLRYKRELDYLSQDKASIHRLIEIPQEESSFQHTHLQPNSSIDARVQEDGPEYRESSSLYIRGKANSRQYLSNQAIHLEIQDARNTYESHMYDIINSILTLQFPVGDQYITRPQNRTEFMGGGHGFNDFHTLQYVNQQRRCFLITQCKAPGQENRRAVWRDAETQLQNYLRAEHWARNQGSRPNAYGMIVNGLAVRFYRYEDDRDGMVEYWSVPSTGYHLQDDHVEIQEVLDRKSVV